MKKLILAVAICLPLYASAQESIIIELTPEMISEEQEIVRNGSYGICVEAGNDETDCTCFSDAIIEKFPPNYMFLLSDPHSTNEEIKDFIDWVATKPCNVNYPLFDQATGNRYFPQE